MGPRGWDLGPLMGPGTLQSAPAAAPATALFRVLQSQPRTRSSHSLRVFTEGLLSSP